MYIIDDSYFTRDLHVPNNTASLDIPNSGVLIESYIDEYARLLLQNALGLDLFNDFDSYLVNGGFDSNSAPQLWIDLVDGVEYTIGTRNYKWRGLRYQQGAFNRSILAKYAYYHWFLDNQSKTTAMGEKVGSAVNNLNVNGTPKSVKIWNEYIAEYQGETRCNYTFSYVNGVQFHDYYSGNDSDYVSLLTFLKDNPTNYPNARLKIEREGFNNSMGI